MIRVAPVLLLLLVACGGAAADQSAVAPTSEATTEPTAQKPSGKGGPQVQNELGEIDQKDAERAFSSAEGAIMGCHKKAMGKLEYLAGDVAFLVRLDAAGKPKYVVIETSTLGDRAAERCMIDALTSAKWPVPQGGEAEARKSLSFTPGDAREPANWPSDKVAALLRDKGAAVSACKKGDAAAYHVTAYVEPAGKEGKIQAVGVASSSPAAFAGADCVADALKSAKVPSPGSYAAKVSFDF